MTEPVSGTPDHAGVWFPPPFVYAIVILVGFLVQHFVPLPALPVPVSNLLGAALVLAGFGFAFWAMGMFRLAKTPIAPIRPVAALVESGPYRITRNPMYLALAVIQVGIGVLTRTTWVVALVPVSMIAMTLAVIRREERYLERRFGEGYAQYRARVRRWL